MIAEAVKALGGEEATIQEVNGCVHQVYGDVNPETISTAMSDLSINGPPSSLSAQNQKFLERISAGRYRVVRRSEERKQ